MGSREQLACIALVHGLTCGCGHALAQGFNRRYDVLGQGLQENGWAIERSGENYLVIGTTPVVTSENIYINPIVYTLLLSAQGEVLASDTFVYEGHAVFPGMWNCMAPVRSGGFISGGSTFTDAWVQKHALWRVSPSGSINFLAEIGPEDQENFSRQAIECKNGDFLLVGETDSTGGIDASLVRTDSAGVLLWSRTYGGPYFDAGWSVDTTADDGFFVGGYYGYAPDIAYPDLWVFRVDGDGDTLWSRVWGEEFNDLMVNLTTKANGNPVLACAVRHFEEDEAHAYMAELDAADGSFIWQREYGPAVSGTSLTAPKEVAPGQGHIVVGALFDPIGGYDSGVMLRTSDTGDSLWMRTFYYHDSLVNYGWGYLYDVVSTLDGGFIACGTSHGEVGAPLPAGYSQDVWIVKVDSLGCIEPGCNIPMGISTQITNLRGALAIAPNPVASGGEVSVQVTLPESLRKEALRLSVVSADGKLITEQILSSRTSAVALPTSGFAGGLYHLHLISGGTWVAGAKLIIE